jgi:hypothetical protein
MAIRTALFHLPTSASFAARRTPARFTSSSATTRASRLVSMATQTDKPRAAEAAVPALWAVCGGLIYTAFARVDQGEVESVEKVCLWGCS